MMLPNDQDSNNHNGRRDHHHHHQRQRSCGGDGVDGGVDLLVQQVVEDVSGFVQAEEDDEVVQDRDNEEVLHAMRLMMQRLHLQRQRQSQSNEGSPFLLTLPSNVHVVHGPPNWHLPSIDEILPTASSSIEPKDQQQHHTETFIQIINTALEIIDA